MNQSAPQPPASAEDIHPIFIGSTVPELTLTMVNGNPFDLKAAIAEKPAVLVFYRGWW